MTKADYKDLVEAVGATRFGGAWPGQRCLDLLHMSLGPSPVVRVRRYGPRLTSVGLSSSPEDLMAVDFHTIGA